MLPILLGWVCIAIPVRALAKPKPTIAVAPLEGDTGNKVAEAVADALDGKDFTVIGPKEVRREMQKLDLPDQLDTRDARKLANRLDAAALIDGTVSKAGKKRSLHLEVHRRGKPDSGFTIEFKSTSSDGFRRGVHDELVKKLLGAGDDDSADDDQARKLAARQAAEEDGRTRTRDDDDARRTKQPADGDDRDARRTRQPAGDSKRKRGEDEPAAGRRKRVAEEEEPVVRKRKKAKQPDEAIAPPVLVRVGAGGSLAQRRLTYDTRSGLPAAQTPPRVVTTAGGGRVDGEIYPIALAAPDSPLAGLGLAGAYDKTFGLAIKIPNQPLRAPINQAHDAIGARYRFGIGQASTLAIGLDYVRRHYIADRSSLMAVVLDAPDVDYTAVAPGIAAHVAVTPQVTLFGGLDGMILFNTGPIQKTASYGPATVYGLDAIGGLDIALAQQIGLRIALEYNQIHFSFSNKGMMAVLRDGDSASQDVMGATDRSIGAAVTLGLTY